MTSGVHVNGIAFTLVVFMMWRNHMPQELLIGAGNAKCRTVSTIYFSLMSLSRKAKPNVGEE